MGENGQGVALPRQKAGNPDFFVCSPHLASLQQRMKGTTTRFDVTETGMQSYHYRFTRTMIGLLGAGMLTAIVAAPAAIGQSASFSSFRTIDSRREGGVPGAVVTALAAEPRSGLLLTAGDDRKIRVYGAWGERLLVAIPTEEWVYALDIDPTGQLFAAADGTGSVTLGSLAKANSASRVTLASSALRAIRFSPDGRYLAVAGFEPRVWMLDVGTGRVAATLPGASGDIRAIAFSPDGKYLAAGGRAGVARLWSRPDLQAIGDIPLSPRRLRTLTFSPDGSSLVAGGDEGTVVFYDLAKRSSVDRWQSPSGSVTTLAFCGPDRLAIGTTDNEILVYDLVGRSIVAQLHGHTGTIGCLHWLADQGVLASGSFDTTARFWRLDRGPVVSERPGVLPEPLR